MKDITCWKVYEYYTNDHQTGKVLFGYSVATGAILEEVQSSSKGHINEYKLYGEPNSYFENSAEIWTDYCTKNNINSVKDISSQYQ
jgi:hypothetical protein